MFQTCFGHVLGIIWACFGHHSEMFWASSRHVWDAFLNTFGFFGVGILDDFEVFVFIILGCFRHPLGIIQTCSGHHLDMFWDDFLTFFDYFPKNYKKNSNSLFFQKFEKSSKIDQKAPTVPHGRIPHARGSGSS